jgi:hypothetical protein
MDDDELCKKGDILTVHPKGQTYMVISDPFWTPLFDDDPSILVLDGNGSIVELSAQKKHWWSHRELRNE